MNTNHEHFNVYHFINIFMIVLIVLCSFDCNFKTSVLGTTHNNTCYLAVVDQIAGITNSTISN